MRNSLPVCGGEVPLTDKPDGGHKQIGPATVSHRTHTVAQ